MVSKFISRPSAFFRALGRGLESISRWLLQLCAILIVIMTLLVGYSIVVRYFLNSPEPWIDELTGYFMVAAALLGSAETLRQGEHIHVDLLSGRLGRAGTSILEIFGLCAVVFLSLCMTISGIRMVIFTHDMELYSRGYMEVPIWIPQLIVPLSFGFLCLVAAMLIGRKLCNTPDWKG
jgi:TRAP-type C4-dicarboxylate transport system permease small subunit